MSGHPTVRVLDVPLAAMDYAVAVAEACAWAAASERAWAVAAANTHVVALARRDPTFRGALEKFDLLLPDGMPLVWIMNRHLDHPLSDRVYGPTFMLRCLEAAQGAQWGHFFLGGSMELLEALRERLLERFPGLNIAGMYAPPFGSWSADEDARILDLVRESGAHFVWIGLGCPKQELWIAGQKENLPPAVYCAVGAAFAFHAGRVRQAPLWMQKRGLEWLFRLGTEPRRLWRRYIIFNSLFVFYQAADCLAKRRPTAKRAS